MESSIPRNEEFGVYHLQETSLIFVITFAILFKVFLIRELARVTDIFRTDYRYVIINPSRDYSITNPTLPGRRCMM